MVPQSSSSTNGGQALPFFCGFWATYRRLVLVPNPHVLLQGAQSVHCDTSQSTEYKFKVSLQVFWLNYHCIVMVIKHSFLSFHTFLWAEITCLKVFNLKNILLIKSELTTEVWANNRVFFATIRSSSHLLPGFLCSPSSLWSPPPAGFGLCTYFIFPLHWSIDSLQDT